MTAIKKPRVHPLIVKSAALLDEVLGSPEWDRLIDLQIFDINLGSFCVLGQTGYRNSHEGRIPGDGTVPWHNFNRGIDYLDEWAGNHPEVCARLGLEIDTVNDAFLCGVPDYYRVDQDDQWKRYLAWRRAVRDQAAEITDAQISDGGSQ